jgi:gluconate 2-dehydrogenase gamma chain
MKMTRREALRLMAATPLFATLGLTGEEVGAAALAVDDLREAGLPLEPEFFTPAEWRTVRVLVDLVIPADEKSGSATDALVPEFMDFMLNEGSAGRQRTMREGLAWLDDEARRRFEATFVELDAARQHAILDDIAWPARAREEMQDGVSWFNTFRDMTAAGFFSSRMGYEDLDYIGNTWETEWTGCPEPALRKLGVSYDLMRSGGTGAG